MAKYKKSFAEGLEDMIQQTLFGDLPEEQPTAPAQEEQGKGKKKKASGKSFSSDLEAFFQETIQDSIDRKAQEIKGDKKSDNSRSTRKKPEIGLDQLIRNTLESGMASEDQVTKRVTFVFDKEKIERLRQIAEKEKARIRDIVDELVTSYIEKYHV